MDIDTVADELYSLPPEQFTAARNASEAQAKAVGDRPLAVAIHELRKPSTGAWLANQLVREHRDEVQSFLELGAALREATAMLSGDQLRQLGKQRRQLVSALIQQVRGLASAAGHKVSQDVARSLEDTLHAALADEQAAERLSAGRLTDTLHGGGFPPGTSATPISLVPDLEPSRSASPQPGRAERSERRRDERSERRRDERSERRRDELDRAERDEQLARTAVREAEDDQARAQAALDVADAAIQQISALVDRLRGELDTAEIEQLRREQLRRTSRAHLDTAHRAGKAAAQRLDAATTRRERLST